MAYSAISTGSSANDGTGDTLRDGAIKVNANFSEVYNKLGNGTNLSSGITADATNVTLTAPILSGVTTTASGNLQVKPASNILEVQGDGSSVEGMIQLNCHANTHGQKIVPTDHSLNASNTLTLPGGDTIGNADATLVSDIGTQTLSNKTLATPDINTPDIDGGNIDGATIGANTPAAVTGTTITSTTTFQLKTYADTTARDAAITSPASGMLIYLTATNKAQVYANNAWVDLH